jgi:P27 family predicted phage terminase small subunit
LKLKILAGNPGKRPLNLREPKTSSELPKCPSHLSKSAKKEWRRISPILAEMKLLTLIDGAALGMYCQAQARWVEANAKIEEFGVVLLVGQSKYPTVSPYVQIANAAFKQMQSLLAEFGMTPSSRCKLQVGAGDAEPSDPLEALKARAQGQKKAN